MLKPLIDTENLDQYYEDKKAGLYTLDFVLKVFYIISAWRLILFDSHKRPLLEERRKLFLKKDEKGFAAKVREMERMLDKCHHSAS